MADNRGIATSCIIFDAKKMVKGYNQVAALILRNKILPKSGKADWVDSK